MRSTIWTKSSLGHFLFACCQYPYNSDWAFHQYAVQRGLGGWNGRRQNINRISLGVVAERGPAGYSEAELAALAWLVDTLRGRYDLAADAVARCGDLDPWRSDNQAGFPWDQFVRRLASGSPRRGRAGLTTKKVTR